jgi:protein-S-isoprenylcysteine O-methyltransferase Ste14
MSARRPAPERAAFEAASRGALAFAWCGAALFAASLAYFLYCYIVVFGRPPARSDAAAAIAIDVLLFTGFASHHSAFARTRVKAAVARLATPALERSVYTWIASLLFIAVCALWQPVGGTLYRLPDAAAWIGYAVQAVGLVITARSSARLDVLDLAGVRPLLRQTSGDRPEHVPLETRGLYGVVRHPLYFGWVLVTWGTPHMTATRLAFAAVSTAYLVLAIPFEERALVDTFGGEYRAYRARVRWRMVPFVY